MKTHSYTVHLSLNASDDGMVIIKEGFCWSSFFLTVPWALFHCMWLESAIFATIQVAIVIIFQFAMLSVTALGIALFAVALVFGFMADEIRQNFFAKGLPLRRPGTRARYGKCNQTCSHCSFPAIGQNDSQLMTVVIVDYGSSNLRSAAKAFERGVVESGLSLKVLVSSNPNDVRNASRIVLPGVGSFADCRAGLMALDGMIDVLNEAVIEKAMPFLGICVGMQLMGSVGLEHGIHMGLGWLNGTVRVLEPIDKL